MIELFYLIFFVNACVQVYIFFFPGAYSDDDCLRDFHHFPPVSQVLPETWALPLPDIRAEYVPLLVSGLTAAISLDKVSFYYILNTCIHINKNVSMVKTIHYLMMNLTALRQVWLLLSQL